MSQPFVVVGKSLPRVDGLDKVTGRALYGPDIKLPGLLVAKCLRSPYPHARILNVDTTKAESLPGVKAVITGKDVPAGHFGVTIKDQTILARDKVRFAGEAVAAVAALDADLAEEAASLIQVDYQELPALHGPLEAMRREAPLIHERLSQYLTNPLYVRVVPGTNICNHFKLRKGDLEAGFSASDLIAEETFTLPMVHHAYTEPHATVAQVSPSGKVTVWANIQAPYQLRADLADAFQMPLGNFRVIATKVGGGFGGKISVRLEPICVALAQRTGRPVKMVMTRAEEFIASAVRHPALIKVKAGAKKDGTLMAIQFDIYWDTGGYAEHGPAVCRNAYSAPGPYQIPNVKVDSYCVYTNNPVGGAFRGFGHSQTNWALESILDTLAHGLGINPLKFRLKNGTEEGSVSPTGEVLHSVGIRQCLEAAAKKISWGKSVGGVRRGQGLAGLHRLTRAFAPSCAFVKLNEDGSLGVMTSGVDIGQGSDTALAQIAAEEFGLSLDKVTMACPDTETTPYDVGALSSRITFHTGNAVRLAAADAKAQLLALVGEKLQASPQDLELGGGRVYVKGSPEKGLTLAELSALSHSFKGGPILGRGAFLQEDLVPLDLETGQSVKPTAYWMYAAEAAEVAVDEETGEISIMKLAAAADVGFAINPRAVEGQIEGAAFMGLAATIWEEMVLDKSKVVNPSLMDYNFPTALDVPRIESVIVEIAHSNGPFGAKGVGESGTPPMAPAIANALYQAAGVRIRDLPLSPERVFKALKTRARG